VRYLFLILAGAWLLGNTIIGNLPGKIVSVASPALKSAPTSGAAPTGTTAGVPGASPINGGGAAGALSPRNLAPATFATGAGALDGSA
jgi:hypothetical protein